MPKSPNIDGLPWFELSGDDAFPPRFHRAPSHERGVFVDDHDGASGALADLSPGIARENGASYLGCSKSELDLLGFRPSRATNAAKGERGATVSDLAVRWWIDAEGLRDCICD